MPSASEALSIASKAKSLCNTVLHITSSAVTASCWAAFLSLFLKIFTVSPPFLYVHPGTRNRHFVPQRIFSFLIIPAGPNSSPLFASLAPLSISVTCTSLPRSHLVPLLQCD